MTSTVAASGSHTLAVARRRAASRRCGEKRVKRLSMSIAAHNRHARHSYRSAYLKIYINIDTTNVGDCITRCDVTVTLTACRCQRSSHSALFLSRSRDRNIASHQRRSHIRCSAVKSKDCRSFAELTTHIIDALLHTQIQQSFMHKHYQFSMSTNI